MTAELGTPAPELNLPDTDRKIRTLAECRGKTVVLAFFPAAFTGVCQKEMCAFRDNLGRLNSANAQVFGISVDSPFANKKFADENQLTFPLLSDVSKSAIKAYGVEFPDLAGVKGLTVAKRSVFIIDGKGTIQYRWVSDDPRVEPNYDEVIAKVNAIA
jgi:peroxiredoxin